MSRKWTPEYLRNGFVDEVKRKRADQGYDTDQKPTHEWLRNNGFGYFPQRVRELEYRPDEWLIEECGFEPQKKEYPCDNSPTVDRIEAWITYEDEVGQRINGTSISTARSHIRRSMEIAEEKIGTTDIFELGRGEREVCFRRAQQVMRGFAEEFNDGQTRYNYATTLRDVLTRMEEKNIIEHDVLTPLVADCGWAGDSTSVNIAPKTSLVKAYFDACETRTEQMVLICLAILGFRPSDFCQRDAIERIHYDAPHPYVEFTNGRKNGPGVVPIVLCQDFIEKWVQFVEGVQNNKAALFPSDKSADGARSTEWVRNTVATIGDRVDETLRNGEKPNPEHFRNFWYTEFTTAFAEFRRDNDFAASVQGSQSARVPVESYTDPLRGSWFETFENFAKPKLEIPISNFQPADQIGNIDIGDIEDDTAFDIVETVRQATLDSWNDAKALLPAGAAAFVTSTAGVAAGRTVLAWAQVKHRGLAMDPECRHYPEMSKTRQAGLGLTLGLLLTLLASLWYMNGTLAELAAGEMTAWLPVALAILYGIWLFDRKIPSPSDALQSMT